MKKSLFAFFFVLLAASPAFAARLHFTPDVPVYLTSNANLDISQSLPGLSLSTRGEQTIKAVLSIKSDKQRLGARQLAFVLKSIRIALKANEEDLQFDSQGEDSSLYLSQVSKLVDRPITINLDPVFTLEAGGEQISRIAQEFPVLQQVQPEALLAELFMHIFALEGVDLSVGKTVERPFSLPGVPSMPKTITYTVTEIDDYHVRANISGKIEKQTYTLSQKVHIDGKEDELVAVSLSGTMEGKGKWNRDNAMLYELEMHYSYAAMFKLGSWEWMMNIGVEVKNRTSLKNN